MHSDIILNICGFTFIPMKIHVRIYINVMYFLTIIRLFLIEVKSKKRVLCEKTKIYDEVVNKWHDNYFQFILDHPNKKWEWYALSSNDNIRADIVLKNYHMPWVWDELHRNPSITGIFMPSNSSFAIWNVVVKHPDKPWDWGALSYNPNITWNIVEKHPDKPWDWRRLSYNPGITWDIVQKYPDKPWDWQGLSYNESVATWDIVQKHPDKPWDWEGLCYNPSFATWDIVQKHPDKPWNFTALSRNISWDIVEKHPEMPWDWHSLSSNPGVTWDIVEKNPKIPWIWNTLCWNSMSVARKKYIENQLFKKYTAWFVQSDLKRELMENRWHPCNMNKWAGWGFDTEDVEC